MSLQGIDYIERGNSLALGVFRVGDSITDDTLKEGLEDTSGLFIDHWCTRQDRAWRGKQQRNLLAEIRLTPPRRARRRIAGLVMP